MDDFHASMDQAREGMKDIARTIAAYRRTLIEEGVPENAATVLAKDFQQHIWRTVQTPQVSSEAK